MNKSTPDARIPPIIEEKTAGMIFAAVVRSYVDTTVLQGRYGSPADSGPQT